MKKKIIEFFKSSIDIIFIICVGAAAIWLILMPFGINLFDYNDKTSQKILEAIKYFSYAGKFGNYVIIIPVVIILSPIYILLIAITKWGRYKYLNKGKIQSAEEYARQVVNSKKEYCLILRPFGNDAYFSVESVSSEYFFESFVSNWTKGIILEQIIQENVTKNTGFETIALVDPDLKFIPISPKFIAAKHETWKYVIFDLLKRALFVFVILPPKQAIRPSLIWEVTKMVQLGLIGRFMIIIPPQKVQQNRIMINDLKEKLYFISDALDFIEDTTYLIYPNEELGIDSHFNKWFKLSKKEKAKYVELLPLHLYSKSIEEVIIKMFKNVEHLSFEARYLHLNRDYSDFDDTMTPTSLQLMIRKRVNFINPRRNEN